MSFEDHVAEVLRTIPARLRDDVCMLGVWVAADGRAMIGWNTAGRLRVNGTPWEWNQWRFECPNAREVEAPERIEETLREMHRDGRIAAALGHAVGFIVDAEPSVHSIVGHAEPHLRPVWPRRL
jgi:hypothetical protein